MKKITHYNIDNINKTGADINLIYGERSGGKSYQVKHKIGIEAYLFGSTSYKDSYFNKGNIIESAIKEHTRFILLRRWKEEITTEKIEQYFNDVDVFKLTNGKCNCIVTYKKQLFIAHYDNESGKTIKYDKIGYVVALSTEQNYAGASYLDVHDIIFEEFMSRNVYLSDEPNKLMNFFSTVDRKRGTTRLWLVGNTITRVCPYLTEWGLDKIIKNQEQGTIKSTWISTGDYDENGILIEKKLAIEHCASTGTSSFVIGTHKDMLNKGSWQSDPQPHLPKSINEYKSLYKFMFFYKGFKFMCEYLKDDKDTFFYIYPYTKEIKNNIIVFSDIISTSHLYQRDIYNISIKNIKLQKLFNEFRENKIFYSTDMCGTEFKQVIDFTIRR